MKENNIIEISIRWSDLDANRHVRHSVYHDWADFARMSLFGKIGLTVDNLFKNHISPVIFREECIFHKEILYGEKVYINMYLLKSTKDYRKWSILHKIMKNKDVLAATLIVEGSWIDIVERKVKTPNLVMQKLLDQFDKYQDFEWISSSKE